MTDATTDAESAREEAERLRAEVRRLRAESGAARPDRDDLARRIFEALRWGDQPWELLKPWSQDRYRAIADGLPAAVGAAPAPAAVVAVGHDTSEMHAFADRKDAQRYFHDLIDRGTDRAWINTVSSWTWHPRGDDAGGPST